MTKMTSKLKALFNGRELPGIVIHKPGRPDSIKDFGRYFEDRPASTKSMGMSVEDFGKAVTGLSQAKPPYSSHAWLQNGEAISEGFAEGLRASQGDTRYKEPKEQPLSSFEEAEEVIHKNDIYSMAREKLENVQRKQVAYGLDKYPEPLNADTWSIEETIDHIMDETMDTMHYLAMLQIKLKGLTNIGDISSLMTRERNK